MSPRRRNRTTTALAALAALLTITGCSAPADGDTSADTGVSAELTCQRIFGADIEGPIADTTDIITRASENPGLSTVDPGKLAATITTLKSAAAMADAEMAPLIEDQIEPLRQLQDAMKTGTTPYVDFTQLKESALELIEMCRPHL